MHQEKIGRWVVLAAFSACLGACGGGNDEALRPDGRVPLFPNACEAVACGDHGECVMTTGGEAACRCDAAFHAEDLRCVPDVAGNECAGVSCSGHGRCVVLQEVPPRPVCICDAGFDNVADTNCVERSADIACGPGTHEEQGLCVPDPSPTPGDAGGPASDTSPAPVDVLAPGASCRSNADCVAPEVCSLGGKCETLSSSRCGLPAGGGCGCGASKACVPLAFHLEQGASTYTPFESGCYPACDPCAPSCDAGKTCIALPSGGGFCHFGELSAEGEKCGGLAKLVCAGLLTCHMGTCRTLCLPDEPSFIAESSVTVRSVASSKDCPTGSYCTRSRSGLGEDGNFTCVEGKLGETGHACGGGGVLCHFPDRCLGVCTPTDCSCPSGIDCFTLLSKSVCIADGAIPLGGSCAEDRNCQVGMRCVDSPYGKVCAPL